MLRRVTVLLIAALFSVSVAGLSFAQTKPSDKPADKPAEKSAPADPCAGKQTTKKKKPAKKKPAAKKKAGKEKAKGEVPGPVEK
jgi:hypothetical protein